MFSEGNLEISKTIQEGTQKRQGWDGVIQKGFLEEMPSLKKMSRNKALRVGGRRRSEETEAG